MSSHLLSMHKSDLFVEEVTPPRQGTKDSRQKMRSPINPLDGTARQQHENLGWHIFRTKLAREIFFEARNFTRKMLQNFPRIF